MRGCGVALERAGQVWRCARGHSFDVARSGYVNLLQPQDRRSLQAGDTREAVEARARALAAGIGRTILTAFVERAAALPQHDGAVVVDLGCGTGDALAAVAALRPVAGIGIDISTVAIDKAARAHPALTWLVANADRRLPLSDHSAALMLSLHARRNPADCARVLEPGGQMLVALPAADDLVELREAVQGETGSRERAGALLAEYADRFTLVDRTIVRERVAADRPELLDLLRGTYRGVRLREAERASALRRMDITLASELFLFTVKPNH